MSTSNGYLSTVNLTVNRSDFLKLLCTWQGEIPSECHVLITSVNGTSLTEKVKEKIALR